MRFLTFASLLATSALAGDLASPHGFARETAPPSLLKANCIKSASGGPQLRAVWEVQGSRNPTCFLLEGAAPLECDATGCSREVSLTIGCSDQPEMLRRLLTGCPSIEFMATSVSADDSRGLWKLSTKNAVVTLEETSVLVGYSEEAEKCAFAKGVAVEPCKTHSEIGDWFRNLSRDGRSLSVRYADETDVTSLVFDDNGNDFLAPDEIGD